MKKLSALESGRFYKVKNPKRKFICALCSAPREMRYTKELEGKNFLQIIALSAFASWALFPLMGVKSFFMIFPLWALVEIINKVLYRKEVPCPYCGFDAIWYRRDVSVANKKVKEYWSENFPELGLKKPLDTAKDAQVELTQGEAQSETTSQNSAI